MVGCRFDNVPVLLSICILVEAIPGHGPHYRVLQVSHRQADSAGTATRVLISSAFGLCRRANDQRRCMFDDCVWMGCVLRPPLRMIACIRERMLL